MWHLAIETSGHRGGLALASGGRVVREEHFPDGLVHGREALPRIRDLLAAAGIAPADLAGIAVGVGPGSYTGTRVGVTAAKTLAWALRIPLVAVSSLEAIARGVAATEAPPIAVAAVVDARRGAFFVAEFAQTEDGWSRVSPDAIARAPEIAARLVRETIFAGDGAGLLVDAAGGRLGRRADPELDAPRAAVVLELASDRLAEAEFDVEAVHRIEPAYLRPSAPALRLAARRRDAES